MPARRDDTTIHDVTMGSWIVCTMLSCTLWAILIIPPLWIMGRP